MLILFLAGCSGSNGKNGATGATGPQGPAGTSGTNGSNGSNGQQGAQGLTGPTMPVIQSLSIQGLPATPGSPVTTTVIAQSAQGLALTYTWTVSPSASWSIASGGSTPTVTITAPAGYNMTGTATIEISDTNGMYALGVIALSTEGDIAPVVNSITASPNPAPRNETIIALVNASDSEGNAISYAWTATTGWTVTGYGTTATVIAPDTYNTGGYLTVTVSDTYGGAATATIALSTHADSPPAISSITASPNPIAINGTMAVSVSTTDSDGNSLSYTWTVPAGWAISSGQGTSGISITAPNSYANSGMVYVTVSDGYGGTASGSINVSIEGDTYPVISSITASPNPVTPNGIITALVNASDSEGNTLSYTWTATTGWTITGHGVTATVIAPSTYNTGGYITVTVSDNYGGVVTGTIAVEDTIPLQSPTGLTATAGNGQVTLNWFTSSSATSYNVYTATTTGGPYIKVGSTTNINYTVTGLLSINGPTYYFVVTAVNSAGESGYSNQASSVAYVIITYTAGFNNPNGIAIDSSGNVWVTNWGNNAVEKIPATGGNGVTYTAGFNNPEGIAIDASGNVWVANDGNNTVEKLEGIAKGPQYWPYTGPQWP